MSKMKKMLFFIVLVLYMFSCAYAETEITFQNIPWLSDDAVVFQSLSDAELVRFATENLKLENKDGAMVLMDDTGLVYPGHISGAEAVIYIADTAEIVKGKVAGYPIKNLIFSFAYNGAYELISVEVKLINGDYNDLVSKLSAKYGEGIKTTTKEGINSTVWYGDNNSLVLIYTESDGFDYTLMYGRLDAADILSQCLAAPDPDDVSGL